MNLYLNLHEKSVFDMGGARVYGTAAHLVPVTTETPHLPETPPSPWLFFRDLPGLHLLDLDTAEGRLELSKIIGDVPLYRISIELFIDRVLLESQGNSARLKGVRSAFSPEDPPEPVADSMSEKYMFAGVLHFPIIASRSDLQLVDLYLRLFGVATPEHATAWDHLLALTNGYPDRILEHCDGLLWRGAGWVRMDRIIYNAERLDHDPEITFESYVNRGRASAESLMIDTPDALLAAWVQAERVQKELCHDIDSVLRLSDIRKLPKWIRADVFRVLEREAMKQVFAEGLSKHMAEWPALRRNTYLSEPIAANARGEVAPLIQQLLNQTLSADARYAGSGEAFVAQAEKRFQEVEKLLG